MQHAHRIRLRGNATVEPFSRNRWNAPKEAETSDSSKEQTLARSNRPEASYEMEVAGCSAIVSFASNSRCKRELSELVGTLLESYALAPQDAISEIAPLP